MKEKHKKSKHKKSEKKNKHKRKKRHASSSSSSSDEWIEKDPVKNVNPEHTREDWMSMTGMIRTFSKDDIKAKQTQDKNHIDSYNPSTSSRELNPYWRDGGSGLPQTPENFRKSIPFIIPSDDEDYYTKSASKHIEKSDKETYRSDVYKKSYNWKNQGETSSSGKCFLEVNSVTEVELCKSNISPASQSNESINKPKQHINKDNVYMSDEKMNKLAAKIVKAEIMGDSNLVSELKAKLETARECRKHMQPQDEDNRVMLMSTNSAGNSRPLTKGLGDSHCKSGKRKAETYVSGERSKYFGNDDKYNLAQMFQNEKYGNNYDDDAQLAKIASKHKNPNDDLEDIFVDEISKNKNEAKESEREKQRAINEHVKIERSLEGCEYCFDSKNMIKHLVVSCGRKVYLSLPSRKSLVKGQCIITTIQHSTCVTALDEDVWDEIMNFRKALTTFFYSQNKDVLFYETATKLHKFPHMTIYCVPLPRDVGDSAAIYFKKALLECEAEWSMNKKVVDLKGKNIRKCIPKGLPYFWIDFGMDPGFAHVIEDQQLFPRNFAEEVIGGILDLEHQFWMKPSREYGDLQRKKVSEFIKEWKSFDTVSVKTES